CAILGCVSSLRVDSDCSLLLSHCGTPGFVNCGTTLRVVDSRRGASHHIELAIGPNHPLAALFSQWRFGNVIRSERFASIRTCGCSGDETEVDFGPVYWGISSASSPPRKACGHPFERCSPGS